MASDKQKRLPVCDCAPAVHMLLDGALHLVEHGFGDVGAALAHRELL